jgi:hypothetical protein
LKEPPAGWHVLFFIDAHKLDVRVGTKSDERISRTVADVPSAGRRHNTVVTRELTYGAI